MRRGRYCRVTTCPNFKGVKKTTPTFNAPAYDPPLRDKWISWLRMVEPKFDERLVGLNFNLCDLHFDTDDMKRNGERYRLVPGTIPKYFIPHPDPLAVVDSENGEDLELDKTEPLTLTESPPQNSEQTIEVDFNTDVISNVREEPKRPSYCTKCIHVNVDVQSLKVKLEKSENRLKTQKSIIDSLRNLLSELKTAQKSEIPKTDVCSICNAKLPAGSLYEHLCIETDDEDGNIKCAYCTRSFRATIALTEHLKFSHLIKSYTASCDECEHHYAMNELLQVHMMTKHNRTVSKQISTQSDRRSPIPMPTSCTQSIEIEPYIPEQLESVKKNIEQPTDYLESPKRTRTLRSHQSPKRMKFEGELSTNSGYSSDGNDMSEMLSSNEHISETITNQVNNKPQLRRIKIIKKKNATSTSGHLPAVGEIRKLIVEPIPISANEDSPLMKPYECGYSCGERFAHALELSLHMRQNHATAVNSMHVECYQCHDTFDNIKDLKEHLANFHEIKASKDKSKLCDQCGLICKTKKQMAIHYESHTDGTNPRKQIVTLNGNPYCDICKISFKWRATYWRHSLKHRDDEGKKYACQHCPLRCVDYHQFKIHMRKHTGETPYQCEYCSKKFRYKKGFKLHLRTHFGEKVYGCQLQDCDERFQYHRDLQEHLRNHHA